MASLSDVVFLLFWCLTASAGQIQLVSYPPATCAAPGSTVTLRCSFTPLAPVARIVWCVSHLICHGTTPSVYDSNSTRNDRRYVYLGDLERDCTLRIGPVRRQDHKTFRFRMETVDLKNNFTQRSGVNVSVMDADKVDLTGQPGRASEGAALTLNCTWRCSFLDLKVLWWRDGELLPETGPALRLGPLTTAQGGNYTCGLSGDRQTTSPPFNLHVEPRRDVRSPTYGLSVGIPAALAVAAVVVVLLLVQRRRRRRRRALDAGNEGEVSPAARRATIIGDVRVRLPRKGSRHVYDDPLPRASRRGPDGQEVEQTAGEVNYAAVQFKAKAAGRPASETEEDVVYSSVTKTQA
ncbi:uncharacterized protein LOC144073222 [Stigmatopora argus]